jgi:endonuclease/exonuclease/phosphatase (EEP) superfamily protein YafD
MIRIWRIKSILWLRVVGLFLLLVAGTQLVQAAPVTNLTVMSFNIWVNGGTSLNGCIDAIRRANADVVGLQECNAATAQTIATQLGYYVLGASDNSIVSRYPILNALTIGNSRGVTVELSPGQRVHLFDCHLTAYPYGPYDYKHGQSKEFVINQENQTRMPGLNQLLAAMRPYVSGPEPVFLVGDFNAPSHFDYTDFPWPTSIACTNAGLGDAYYELHQTNRKFPPQFAFDDPGITWTPRIDQEPEGVFDRIDFVYYSLTDGTTATSAIELDSRNSVNPWPSDHRAVLAVFRLTPPVLGSAPSTPTPANASPQAPLTSLLTWLPASNMLSQAVYFGTNTPGSFRTNTTNSFFNPGKLLPTTTYYWRIDTTVSTGVLTGPVWSFTTAEAIPPQSYEWTFALGDIGPALGNGLLAFADAATPGLTRFGTTDGTTVPHMSGQPAKYMYVPQLPAPTNGCVITLTDSMPNSGGAYINQYTVIQDLLVPPPLNWTALFNTNPQNANDADFYINASGALGIGDLGYSANGVIAANTWYRIAFAADLGAGVVSYYVNGTRVYRRTGGSLLDGRFSLYSDFDPGPDLLLFNEGDTSGNYTHPLYLSAWAFVDRTMSDSEIAALGGPKPSGILPGSPMRIGASHNAANILLQWTGGKGPFQTRRVLSFGQVWQNVGSLSYARAFAEPLEPGTAFYRVLGY